VAGGYGKSPCLVRPGGRKREEGGGVPSG